MRRGLIRNKRSPEGRDPVGGNARVAGDDRHPLDFGLRDEQPVKRVPLGSPSHLYVRQRAVGPGVGHGDRQERKTLRYQLVSPRLRRLQLAQRGLDRNLQQGARAEERLLGPGDRVPCGLREVGVVCEPPQRRVGVEEQAQSRDSSVADPERPLDVRRQSVEAVGDCDFAGQRTRLAPLAAGPLESHQLGHRLMTSPQLHPLASLRQRDELREVGLRFADRVAARRHAVRIAAIGQLGQGGWQLKQRMAVLSAVCGALVLLALAIAPASRAAEFGFQPGTEGFDVTATKLDGSPAVQAGSHPYELTTHIGFAPGPESPGQPGAPFPAGDVKDLSLELPGGLVGNPTVTSLCTLAEFNTPRESPWEQSLSGENCPDSSQVGVVAVKTSLGGGEVRHFGVFNLTPPPGYAVELGFAPFGSPVTFGAHVRNEGSEYGLTAEIQNFPQALSVDSVTLTLWGTPWAVSHDTERGDCLNEAEPAEAWGKCSVGPPSSFHREAFLTMPTSCSGPLAYHLEADSWQEAGKRISDSIQSHDSEGDPEGLEGCQRLSLETFSYGQPTTTRTSSASGFEFNLEVKQEGLREPGGLSGSQIRDAVVSLPEGMTINPSVGAGLGVCAPAEYAAETASSPPGAACPNESRIGDFRVETPLVDETVTGAIYLAKPFDNPFNALIGVYLVAKSIPRGILVKVPGEMVPDPTSGRLTAIFNQLPELPYSHLRIFFREGQRAPLASPEACGNYQVGMDLTPWLNSETVIHHSSEFTLNQGPGGGACPGSGPPPFSPGALDGSVNPNAGSYSPYYLHLTRNDTEQEITSYSAVLPPGLLGKLAGVATCSDAAIAAAKAQSGLGEIEDPSCPASSEIGHTVAGYGLGGVLDYSPGRLYLAGPYRGAPLSIVAIDSALVGPFDLGVILVRSAIRVDPFSSQVSIDTSGENPFPHILDGIPLHLRDVRVYLSRPQFMINPTSCQPFQATSILAGSSPPFTNPNAASAAPTNLYQATDCSSLKFAPKFSLSLIGPAHRGAYPALRAVVRERAGDANINSAAVALPHAEFLAQEHIDTTCSARLFHAHQCPAGSIYGHARAFTPLLEKPLEGPVYLAFLHPTPLPDLVADLHGQNGLEIVLDGAVSTGPGGGMRADFTGLPDAPASKFVMKLFGARRGLLRNSANLCAAPSYASGRLVGQDNGAEPLDTRIGVKCPKHGKGKKHSRRGRR